MQVELASFSCIQAFRLSLLSPILWSEICIVRNFENGLWGFRPIEVLPKSAANGAGVLVSMLSYIFGKLLMLISARVYL
ncbi:hypothetical protein V6N12_067813 [Hibiscus sabdariffa]|uniref:Uncharacterized protein n=1 Tax=Hibiscus sabdariffa TaxID=183260 RepID=A0ABR2FN57_9ROSI